MFYKGTVNAYDNLSGKHRVLYDDGEWEFLDLCSEPVLIEHSLDSFSASSLSYSTSTSPRNEYLSGNDPLVFCKVEDPPVSDNLPKKAGRGRPPKSTSPNVIKPPLLSTSHEINEKKDLKRKEMDDSAIGSLSYDRRISSRLTIPSNEDNSIKRGAKKGGREPKEIVKSSARDIKDVNSSHSKLIGRPPRTAAVMAAANIKNNSKL
jgi:hypothetical protein